jgi:hypothetical protein
VSLDRASLPSHPVILTKPSIHRPFGSMIDNPGTRLGGNNVMNPESVCGTRLAWYAWRRTGLP